MREREKERERERERERDLSSSKLIIFNNLSYVTKSLAPLDLSYTYSKFLPIQFSQNMKRHGHSFVLFH